MTLHEAIEKVLTEHSRPLTAGEIAAEINKQGLYLRKDKNPVPSSQIHARIKNYSKLFRKNEDGKFSLKQHKLGDPELDEFLKGPDDLITTNADTNTNALTSIELNELDIVKPEDYFNSIYSFLDERYYEDDSSDFDVLYSTVVFIFAGKVCFDYPEEFPLYNSEKYFNSFTSIDFRQILQKITESEKFKHVVDPFYMYDTFYEGDYQVIFNILFNYNYKFEVSNSPDFGKEFNNFLTRKLKRENNNYIISPSYLSEFIAKLINPKKNDKIYDPAMGIGSFFSELNYLFECFDFFGQEIDETSYSYSRINAYLNGYDNFEKFKFGDSLVKPLDISKGADIAVTHPPFSDSRLDISRISPFITRNIVPSDFISGFLLLMLSQLNDKGKLFIVVPENYLISSKTHIVRKYIVSSNLLELVIGLTNNIFYSTTEERTCILVLNKAKTNNAFTFVDATDYEILKIKDQELEFDQETVRDYFDTIIDALRKPWPKNRTGIFKPSISYVGADSITENGYLLKVERYTNLADLILLEKAQEGETIVNLSNIIKNQNFPSLSSVDIDLARSCPYVTVKNLSISADDPFLHLSNIEKYNNQEKGARIISQDAILIATIGDKIKPTIFKFENQPIIISKNILAFNVDTELVLPEYVILQLNLDAIQLKIDSLKLGATIPYFRKNELLSLSFPLPSISEQTEEIKQFYENISEKNKLVQFINEIIIPKDTDQLKKEIVDFVKLNYCKNSLNIQFKFPLEFEVFPFKDSEVKAGIDVKSSTDKLIKYLLIKDRNSIVQGVLVVDEENEIGFQIYNEINAFTNFLINSYKLFTESATNETLMRFAHTSKNLFAGLQGSLDAIINSQNTELNRVLQELYIDNEEFIERKVKAGKAQKKDFLAINKLVDIKNKISAISSFYFKTDSSFKKMIENIFEYFDIKEELILLLNSNENVNSIYIGKSFRTYAKKNAVLQAIMDLIQNSIQYSSENKSNILVEEKENYIQITIINPIKEVLSIDIYNALGKKWITKPDSNPGAGFYWACQLINDSLGETSRPEYLEYVDSKEFKIDIKLRKSSAV